MVVHVKGTKTTAVELAGLIRQALSVPVGQCTSFCPCAAGALPLFVYCPLKSVTRF